MKPVPASDRLADFEGWVESSPQPIAVLRWADQVVVAANAVFLALAGLPRAALIGQADPDRQPWQHPQQRQAPCAALEDGARAGHFVVDVCTRDGGPRQVSAAAHRVDLGGTPHVVLILSDPQGAEAALSALQATLRYVEEAAPLGLWDWNPVSGHIHYSAGMAALFGLPAAAFRARYRDFARQVHPLDAERVVREREAVIASGTPTATEYRIVRPDGKVRWLAVKVSSHLSQDGVLQRAHGLVLDVTEARYREQALLLQQQIIDKMAEGVVLCSAANGLIVYANARYEAMLGHGAGELTGQPGSIVNSPAEADPQQTAHDIMVELRRVGVWSGILRNRRKDGRDIWIRVSIATTVAGASHMTRAGSFRPVRPSPARARP
jgi:PAS domain S-box-containing protein